MKKLFFIPLLLSFTFFITAIILGVGNVLIFADGVSLVLVIAPTFFVLLTFNHPAEMGRYFTAAMEDAECDAVTLKKGITFFRTMLSLLIFSGVMGTVLGFIAMLAYYNTSTAARGFSAALVTTFYCGLLAGFIALPFKAALQNKLAELNK